MQCTDSGVSRILENGSFPGSIWPVYNEAGLNTRLLKGGAEWRASVAVASYALGLTDETSGPTGRVDEAIDFNAIGGCGTMRADWKHSRGDVAYPRSCGRRSAPRGRGSVDFRTVRQIDVPQERCFSTCTTDC